MTNSNKLKPIIDSLITTLGYVTYFILIPYAAIQFRVLKDTQNRIIIIIKICLGLFLTMPWIIISVAILSPLFLYKQMIIIILKCKLKSKFHGLIVGIDSLLTLYEDSEQNVCSAFLVKSLKTEEEFKDSLRTQVNNEILSKNTPKKINCVRRRFMGHLYFKEVDDIDADELIKRISLKKLTRDMFCSKIDTIFQTETPRNNLFNWDIFWSTFDDGDQESNNNTYIVLLRLHHTLGDAVAFYNIITNLLCQRNDDKDSYAESLKTKNDRPKKFSTKIENLFELSPGPKNCLIYPSKKGRGVYSYVLESGEISCLQKMRTIRKAVKDAGVLSIIATGYSAAISSFIKRKDLSGFSVPNRVLLVTPIQVKKGRVKKYFKNQFCDNMNNDFACLSYFVPFRNDTEMGITERFRIIIENISAVYNSCDYTISYVLMKSFIELLPNIIMKRFKRVSCAGTIGMGPGGPKLTFFNGDELLNIIPIVPALEDNGASLTVISYANRFTLSMVGHSDDFSYQDLTDILNETFSNIDLLHRTVKTTTS